MRWGAGIVGLALVTAAEPVTAAELPAHEPMAILLIADEVNPHGLSAAELTQPADIETALEAGDSGLSLAGGVQRVDSQCVDDALDALAAATPPDVIIYFAHRSAQMCGGGDAQPALTAAVEQFLVDGGGVVVFHHGLYVDAGKGPILQLLGAQASSIEWNTVDGQRVFAVDEAHFVTSNGVDYDGTATYDGAAHPYFDNIPDERYPNTQLLTEPGEDRTSLFATDSGGMRTLGYALVRDGWAGRVVAWQPAEYQPNALDDRDGNPFQIFANAIYFAAAGPAAAGDGGPTSPDAGGNADADAGLGGGGGGGCCETGRGVDRPALLLAFALLALVSRWPSRTRSRRGGARLP